MIKEKTEIYRLTSLSSQNAKLHMIFHQEPKTIIRKRDQITSKSI